MAKSCALGDLFQTYQTCYIVKRNLIPFSVYELLSRAPITNSRVPITNKPCTYNQWNHGKWCPEANFGAGGLKISKIEFLGTLYMSRGPWFRIFTWTPPCTYNQSFFYPGALQTVLPAPRPRASNSTENLPAPRGIYTGKNSAQRLVRFTQP